MSGIRRYGKAILKDGWRIVGSYFVWMRKYAKHPEKYPFEKRYKRVQDLASRVVKDMDIDYIIEGEENIPSEGTYAVFGNHLSILDPLSLAAILKKPISFIGKKEIIKMPFAGKIMQDVDGLFLDREDLKQSLKIMMKVQKDLETGTKSYVVFPEGTRNKDPMKKLGEFHHGTFRPAMKAKVPLVPVVFYGTHQGMKANAIFKKYPVFIKFLKPIMPEEYEGKTTNEMAKHVQNLIQSELSFNLRKRYHEYMSRYKNYSFNHH